MMAEYIEREALVHHFMTTRQYLTKDLVMDAAYEVSKFPAADVAPVVHGRWEPVLEGVWNLPTPVLVRWRCSECGRTEQEKEPYCNCGARMDGDGNG